MFLCGLYGKTYTHIICVQYTQLLTEVKIKHDLRQNVFQTLCKHFYIIMKQYLVLSCMNNKLEHIRSLTNIETISTDIQTNTRTIFPSKNKTLNLQAFDMQHRSNNNFIFYLQINIKINPSLLIMKIKSPFTSIKTQQIYLSFD